MTRALITIEDRADRDRAIRWIEAAPVGCRVEFKAEKRSVDQNSALWAMLTDVSKSVIWHGRKLTPADWKDIFTASLKRAQIVPNIDGDGFVQIGLHTSDMTKEEMSNLLELIAAFGAQYDVPFKDSNPPRPPADAPAVTDPVSPDGGAAGAANHDSNGVPGNTPDDDGGGSGSAMEPTEENSGNDQTPPPRVSCGLPQGWEIVYAAALRRAQKKESLAKLAKQFWSQEAYAQFGGWAGVKQSLEGDIAIRIYDAFATNFGHAERIEDELREIF